MPTLAIAEPRTPQPEGSPPPEPTSATPQSEDAPPPEPTLTPSSEAPASDLPAVELVDVATGATVNLAGYAPSDRPIVLWFWAPH
ncbi:hypothetical protein [Candidatus Poriferisocius sp.]|uniref:hypothetical protein n=1 Tax=Candidatus Poriferisocius sp. TaxID=3101276 RepID=UPI003B015358